MTGVEYHISTWVTTKHIVITRRFDYNMRCLTLDFGVDGNFSPSLRDSSCENVKE